MKQPPVGSRRLGARAADRDARGDQGDRRRRRDGRAGRVHRLAPAGAGRFRDRAGLVPRDGRRAPRADRRRGPAGARAPRQGRRIAPLGERDAAAVPRHHGLARRAAEVQRGRRGERCSGDPDAVRSRAKPSRSIPTFASAWSLLGAMLSNYGGSTVSDRLGDLRRRTGYRERLPHVERDRVMARYYASGTGTRPRARRSRRSAHSSPRGDSDVNSPRW